MPSSNLRLLGNDDVIYKVITRKFRASVEPFWDLKIGIYVEYLTHVSSEYIISWVLLSLTSTTGRTSRVLLADVIPWINKASLVLYIVCTLCATLRPTWCSEAVWRCRVCLLWLKIISVEVQSRLQTPSSMWLGLYMWRRVRTMLTTFYHTNHYAATGHVVKFSLKCLSQYEVWAIIITL